MATQSLLTQLLALTEPAAQRALLHAHSADIDDGLIDALKARADQELRADHTAALAAGELLYYAAALTGDPLHRALALFAEANVCAIGGLGDYQRAIDLCDEAAAIYAHARLPVDQADAQVTKIFALAMLGRYDEALQAGAWAATVLSAHKEWLRLATIMMNVAIVYGRMGKDVEALAHFDRAGELYTLAGEEGTWSLPGVAMNRALVLRNLGRFVESLAANREAIDRLESLGQHAEVGHAQQTMAFTYYTLGHYNEALTLLDKAERLFANDERQADLLVTALYRGHCLLEMQRYAAVIALSDSVAALAFRLQQPFEEGYALFNKALAHAGLHQATQALDLLTAARALFAQDGNLVWASEADLAAARLLLALGKGTAAHERAAQCVRHFAEHHLPLHTARAQLLVAEALFALCETVAATEQLAAVEATLADQRLLPLAYHAAYLRGQIAETTGDLATARQFYDQAIVHMEQLRGRLMVEHRADFLAGKERVYAAALRLALAQDEPAIAHIYADRARSRALHDLLTLRIDLRIRAHNDEDAPLVAELNQLRRERDHHYRRTLHANEFAAVMAPSSALATPSSVSPAAVEERIATLWHALLVRNADYARDQWLDGEGTERTDTSSSFFEDKSDLTAMQARLPEDTALLSYYRGDQTLTLFVLTRDHITATTLPLSTAQLQRLIELLRLNMGMAAASDANHLPALVLHAQRILHQLYQQLLAPVHAKLAPYRSLIIVPHGPLHYLPFHALVTHLDPAQPATSRYLLDEYTVSYLPGASFLTAAHERKPQDGSWVALGHTYGGQLPHVLAEVQSIGALGKATVYTEADATKARLAEVAPAARLLHLATHGDFRAENPLFSGLALDDGWLSTLDIFHLRTNASLVTLSACQTGRSTLGGGDELLGLMRAFLAAGAASIVLTLWSVHDESTALFMTHFYHALIGGATKGAALRAAQLALRNTHASAGAAHPYAHPYFWAPFLLTGSAGSL